MYDSKNLYATEDGNAYIGVAYSDSQPVVPKIKMLLILLIKFEQLNYNLNIIKDTFDSEGFVMADITEDGSVIPMHKGYVSDNHIFVRGGTCEECNLLSNDGLSDHDIVIATFSY